MALRAQSWSLLLAAPSQADWDRWNWGWQQGGRQLGETLEYTLEQSLDFLRRLAGLNSGPEFEQVPSWLEPFVLWMARGLAIALIGLLLYWLSRFLQPWFGRWRTRSHRNPLGQTRDLPPAQNLQQWLAQAREAQLREDYATACRALYMALLLRLELSGWLSLDPTRTNREYLQGLDSLWILDQRPLHLRDGFHRIFQTHDRLYYGNHPISVETWQHCQAAYQNLEAHLLQQPTAP